MTSKLTQKSHSGFVASIECMSQRQGPCVSVCHGSQSHSRYGLLNRLFFNVISAATKTTKKSNNPQNKLSKRKNNPPGNCIPFGESTL